MSIVGTWWWSLEADDSGREERSSPPNAGLGSGEGDPGVIPVLSSCLLDQTIILHLGGGGDGLGNDTVTENTYYGNSPPPMPELCQPSGSPFPTLSLSHARTFKDSTLSCGWTTKISLPPLPCLKLRRSQLSSSLLPLPISLSHTQSSLLPSHMATL